MGHKMHLNDKLTQKVFGHGPNVQFSRVWQSDCNNTNVTFLYKIDIKGFLSFSKRVFFKFQQKISLVPVGIELTIDHHWFKSLIQLC